MPMGQIPVLKTKDGVLNQSNVIARYVAKKHGMYYEKTTPLMKDILGFIFFVWYSFGQD